MSAPQLPDRVRTQADKNTRMDSAFHAIDRVGNRLKDTLQESNFWDGVRAADISTEFVTESTTRSFSIASKTTGRDFGVSADGQTYAADQIFL
jgi:hypothetical protein